MGATLGVATILEGTLRRAGTRLRITVQRIDAADGHQPWSERYERVIEDVVAVQDEIAATITERLRLSLAVGRGAAAGKPPTANLATCALSLDGRAWPRRRGRSILEALACFKQAVALDAEYARAWAGPADGYTTSAYSGLDEARLAMPRALEAARRALALAPELVERSATTHVQPSMLGMAAVTWSASTRASRRSAGPSLTGTPSSSCSRVPGRGMPRGARIRGSARWYASSSCPTVRQEFRGRSRGRSR